MTRTGKIARLPLAVRDELNRRLLDGEATVNVLLWLNQMPETRALLSQHFDNVMITPQNLSDWRQGGYEEWRLQHEAFELMDRAGESLEEVARRKGATMLERIETALLLTLLVRLRAAEAMEEGWKKTRAVLEVARTYERLQRSQHDRQRAVREQTEEEQAEAEAMFRGSELLKKHWWDVGRHFKTVKELKEGQHRPLPPDVLAFFLEEAAFEVRNDQALRRIALGRSWKSRGFQPFDEWDRPEEKAAAAAAAAKMRAAASAPVPVVASSGTGATPGEQPAKAAESTTVTPPAAAVDAVTAPVDSAVPAGTAGAPAEIAANPAKSCQIAPNVDRSQPPPEQLYEWGRGGFRKVGEADAA